MRRLVVKLTTLTSRDAPGYAGLVKEYRATVYDPYDIHFRGYDKYFIFRSENRDFIEEFMLPDELDRLIELLNGAKEYIDVHSNNSNQKDSQA